MRKGMLFVVSGFSGSGKGTVMKWFREREEYALSVSCTSRKPREGEVDGKDYFFIDHEDFVKKASEGYFLEHAISRQATRLVLNKITDKEGLSLLTLEDVKEQ